ncbi:MAG: ribonuclease H-like domain-containing protein [Chitinophagaceae bacterium]|nr:ribonuclease H-like domain-containing protein [Chitinophagaceae bacterium]
MLNELLLLDIETIPQMEAFEKLDPDWQSLFREKLSKTVPEGQGDPETYSKKAGILAEFGKIICISTAVFHKDGTGRLGLKHQNIYGHDEVEILRSFTDFCDRMHLNCPGFQFAGHNIREFDIPYICRRMLINRLPLPHYLQLHDKKPWELKMFDTMNWWKFGDYKNYTSLNLLAKALGVPGSKDDMNGSMVQEVYYRQQDLPKIARYCEKDVIVTANIILRFMNLPLLQEEATICIS